MYVRYWVPGVPQWLPELIALILLLCLNMVAVSLFGELEFWFALIKVVAIIAFIIVGTYMILTHLHIGTQLRISGFRLVLKYFFPNGDLCFCWSHFELVVTEGGQLPEIRRNVRKLLLKFL